MGIDTENDATFVNGIFWQNVKQNKNMVATKKLYLTLVTIANEGLDVDM